MEEDVRLPPDDRVRRPRPGRNRGAARDRAADWQRRSNTAADHIEATRLALKQLPAAQRKKVLVRADSGGGTHEFLTWLTRPSRRLQYSVGLVVTPEEFARSSLTAVATASPRRPELLILVVTCGVRESRVAGDGVTGPPFSAFGQTTAGGDRRRLTQPKSDCRTGTG